MFVESPTKVKSIGKYLADRNIRIFATSGHIRDLAKNCRFGPGKLDDIKWETDNSKIIKEIREEAKKANRIYLSTDPDREGEAISWHIFSVIDQEHQKKCLRAVFNEITEKAVKRAIDNPRELDIAQVHSYLARRLLDRWIGYKLSKYTSSKIGGESAGRVQSIALKFLADREEEIKSFKLQKWFVLDVVLNNDLKISLSKMSKDLVDQIGLFSKEDSSLVRFKTNGDAENFIQKLDEEYKLEHIGDPRIDKGSPPEVLKTSTLFEKSINKFGMKSEMVREAAQKLYEGINLGGEVISLITYPRTDRTELSEEFVKDLRKYISAKYTDKYLKDQDTDQKLNQNKKNNLLVQGAHEGIRPVDLNWTPERVGQFLSPSSPEYKIYRLIWAYTLASFFKPSQTQSKRYIFSNQENLFTASETEEIFDGYKKIMREQNLIESPSALNPIFQNLQIGTSYIQKNFQIEEKKNQPPAKYSEATLIKDLEKKGIGRPSTYPTISRTVQTRNYVVLKDKKFEITSLGYKVSKDLDKNFSNFISYDYTRNMEEELDNISKSKTDWKQFLESFFEEWNSVFVKAEKFEVVEGKSCPKCGSELVFRFSKKRINGQKSSPGRFIGCKSYPNCYYRERSLINKEGEEILEKKCPECDSVLVKKKNRWNNFFVGCSNHPNCKYKEVAKLELVENAFCQGCSAQLVYKISTKRGGKKFAGCPNYPSCKYNTKGNRKKENSPPPVMLNRNCPKCNKSLEQKVSRWGKPFISCTGYPGCRYSESIKTTENTN